MFFRKQRRIDSNQASSTPSTINSSTGSSRSPFSLAKTLSRTSIELTDDNLDESKGPLGLTLLHSPPKPEVDFIFVHGLGGDSRKTWTKASRKSHYWPKVWLPQDPSFSNVRIHTFGYDSNYLKGKGDCLNIHHIGKTLLGAICTSPCLADSKTPIVAIGHSMGGLVMKKAYIMANQNAAHATLAQRFAAFYFLATPHRGADSVKMLRNMLKIAYDRAYIGDLDRNSQTIQVINDEFRHYSAGVELWSFYETLNMKLFSSPIVDPESAVLGYREEKQIPMTADHRSVCKFETPDDANFKILRNSLASTLKNLAPAITGPTKQEKRNRMKDLKTFLDVSDVPEDDLSNVCDARMQDSCQWISTKTSYLDWRDDASDDKKTLWIKGGPATGKSVLTGYVVDQLQQSGTACSFFFFKHGDKSKSGLSRCLRSLAFQMAISNDEAGDAILEMQADGILLDNVDERTLWRILFLSGILRVPMNRHYWIIDALDECSNPSLFFDAILPRLDGYTPLRIFITSRDTMNLDQKFSVTSLHNTQYLLLSTTDTLPDLRLLIERKIKTAGVVGQGDQTALAETILDKSRGSFLWTVLVLQELSKCHSKSEIDQILEQVPRGMELLYQRTLDVMSQASRGKDLAKAILEWATCAVRPMTTDELNGALSLQMRDSFPRLGESIIALCGQFVIVDKLGKVQMIHETAREFLVDKNLDSEFSVDKEQAHTRIAQVCLSYLNQGEKTKAPRLNRHRLSVNKPTTGQDFAAYACGSFSYHLSKSDARAEEPLQFVEQFFSSNVLTWIKTVAESRNLKQLTHASKHLKRYMDACAVERSPLDPKIRALRQWAADLARISATFASALTTSPSSIYSSIPSFCPTGSMIYHTSGHGRRLKVLGASHEQWDDRLLCIDFRPGQPSSLCYGDELLAVGLTSGSVHLYNATSYQEYAVLHHGEAVKLIAFQGKTDVVATCGLKTIQLWDSQSGQVTRTLESPPRPLDMAFDENRLIVACHKNYLVSWDLDEDMGSPPLRRSWRLGPDTSQQPPRQPPCALTLSINLGVLAVAYSGQPITLWDIEEDVYIGSCGKKLSGGETSTHVVVALAFNPNPNIELLVVAYLDGDLALLDPFSDQQLECFRANCQSLAPSPSGRLLAAGAGNGVIHVYEFDTLKLVYRVKSTNSYIKHLAFAKNSLTFVDIRGSQCTIWKPETLLRDSLSDDSSGTTSASVVETVSVETKTKITAMVAHPSAEIIFCGREDGAVVLYDRRTATLIGALHTYKTPVRFLAWCCRKEALLSVDSSNKMLLHVIQKTGGQDWLTDTPVILTSQLDSEEAITGVLVGEAASNFLVSTRGSDHLLSLDDGEEMEERKCFNTLGTRKWTQHPASALHLVLIDECAVHVFAWADLLEVKSLPLPSSHAGSQLKWAGICTPRLSHSVLCGLGNATSGINIVTGLDTNNLALENTNNAHQSEGESIAISDATSHATCLTNNPSVSLNILQIIGMSESGKLVFMDRASWVCSVDLGAAEANFSRIQVLRHFFIPYHWFAGRRDIVCQLIHGDIALTRGGDLAIIRGGLEFAERVMD